MVQYIKRIRRIENIIIIHCIINFYKMNIEEVRKYCITKPGVTEGFPFNDTALVFKIGKIFAILDLSEDGRGISLKCDPERALELRELYPEVTPAWHLNQQNWNGVDLNGNLSSSQIKEWIDHSYELVYNSLSNKIRKEIENYDGK